MKFMGAGRRSKDLDKEKGVQRATVTSEQNQATQIPITDEEDGHEVLFLAEKLIAINGH